MAKETHLFDFQDYKAYLEYRAKQERGLKSALAVALNCQSAYVSQILNGFAHLSLEQADLANKFFAHTEKESHYFILLIQEAKAGTKSLKEYFQNQLKQFKEEQLSYLKRKDIPDSLVAEDQAVYYSTWEYNVIHMAVTIPGLRTKSALMKAFKIPETKLNRYIEFLVSKGLIKQKGSEYFPGSTENYLARNSPFVRQLHLNTRALALQSLDRDSLEDAHYSVVVTLSKKDVIALKKRINEYIAEIVEIAQKSKEEHIFALSLDYFDIQK